MLHCEVIRGEETVASYEALNDVVLTKMALARVISRSTGTNISSVSTKRTGSSSPPLPVPRRTLSPPAGPSFFRRWPR
jgi:hypothetical protein